MRQSTGRLIIGVVLVLLGVFFLADNYLFFPWQLRHMIFSFPMIIIIVGIIILANNRDSHSGLIVIAVGIAFMVFRYYHIPFGIIFRDYWPVLLILFGLTILIKPRRRVHSYETKHNEFEEFNKKEKDFNTQTSYGDFLNETAVFNSIDRRYNSSAFKGGKITTVFGGGDIDLRDCKLAEGKHILNVEIIFGGLDISVPKDWRVIINVTSIFGGFDDQRRIVSEGVGESSGVLEINGTVIFGGGDVKN